MFLKFMLRIDETIYPNLGYPPQKQRKSTFSQENWYESAWDIIDAPETYVENSWGP